MHTGDHHPPHPKWVWSAAGGWQWQNVWEPVSYGQLHSYLHSILRFNLEYSNPMFAMRRVFKGHTTRIGVGTLHWLLWLEVLLPTLSFKHPGALSRGNILFAFPASNLSRVLNSKMTGHRHPSVRSQVSTGGVAKSCEISIQIRPCHNCGPAKVPITKM